MDHIGANSVEQPQLDTRKVKKTVSFNEVVQIKEIPNCLAENSKFQEKYNFPQPREEEYQGDLKKGISREPRPTVKKNKANIAGNKAAWKIQEAVKLAEGEGRSSAFSGAGNNPKSSWEQLGGVGSFVFSTFKARGESAVAGAKVGLEIGLEIGGLKGSVSRIVIGAPIGVIFGLIGGGIMGVGGAVVSIGALGIGGVQALGIAGSFLIHETVSLFSKDIAEQAQR